VRKRTRSLRARHGEVIDHPAAGAPLTKSSYNRQLVRAVLYRHGPASRVELGELTGLKLPVLTHVCADLLEQGIVRETAAVPAGGGIGRRRTLLEVACAGLGAIAVRYDSQKVDVALLDLVGTVRWRRRFEGPFATADAVLRSLRAAIKAALAASPFAPGRLLALGACDPGIIAEGRSLGAASIPGWRDQPIRELLGSAAKLPVFLDRDAAFEALGEAVFGAARESRCTLFVTSSHGGIGGAMVDGRRLIAGRDGRGGEIGHVFAGGDLACACGLRGCLEAWIKPARLAELVRSRLGGAASARLDPLKLVELVEAGDRTAIDVVAEAAVPLARVLGSAIHLLSPDMIVFGGVLARLGPTLIEEVRAALPRFTIPVLQKDVRLERAQLDADASFLGVVARIREDLFALPAAGGRAPHG
jgi:predicted NBD/HSP70 family sugar kinase